jgi:hypothetical protein
MYRFITPWGWVYLGIALAATAVAAIHFVTLESRLSLGSEQMEETALRRLQSSTEWLYIAFNAAIFGVLYLVNPVHLGR